MNFNHKNISIILVIFLIIILLVKNVKDNFKNKLKKEEFRNKLLSQYGLDKDRKTMLEDVIINFNLHDFDKKFMKTYDYLKVNINRLVPYFEDKLEIKTNRLIKRKTLIYPIHIILVPINPKHINLDVDINKKINYDYIYMALFNNGGLYTKLNLEDRFWSGPLKNSISLEDNEYNPMRNISLDKNGYLLGIDYNGYLYKKPYDLVEPEHKYYYENKWKLVSGNFQGDLKMKYIMNKENDKYYFINMENNLKECNYNKEEIKIVPNITYKITDDLKLEKIYKNNKGYLLFIDKDYKLYKSEDKEKDIKMNNIKIDTSSFNPSKIVDIIYDYDMKLQGLSITNIDSLELVKQELESHLSIFKKKVNEDNKKMLLTNNNIISFKNNIVVINNEEFETLEDSYYEQKKDDYISFKKFCKDRFGNNYIDASFLNKKEKNDKIIEELNNLKNELLNLNKYNLK